MKCNIHSEYNITVDIAVYILLLLTIKEKENTMPKKTIDTIIDCDTDFIEIRKHRENDLTKARKLVNKALSGKLGFCYPLVNKYYRYQAGVFLNEIDRLKREKLNPTLSSLEVWKITEMIKELKEKAERYVIYDTTSKKQLYNNYTRLKRALDLLVSGNEVVSYTLIPLKARLRVTWMKDLKTNNPVKIIENPLAHCKMEPMELSKAQKDWEYLNDVLFCGAVTKQEVIRRRKDKLTKLSKDQREQAKRGVKIQ